MSKLRSFMKTGEERDILTLLCEAHADEDRLDDGKIKEYFNERC